MHSTGDSFIGFVGTYTNGQSKGIYSFELDTVAGKITDVNVAATVGNPTYLCITKDRRLLYSVIKEGDSGGLVAFAIHEDTRQLELLNFEVEESSPPCHVSTNDQGNLVFSANYHKGTVQSYRIHQDGTITPPVSTIRREGHGPDPRQEKPYTHFAGMTPDNKYLAVVELGGDLLLAYAVTENGELAEVCRMEIRPGSGPRHLAFHPTNPAIAYLMTELSSEVIVLSYSAQDGRFSIIESITTLPDDFRRTTKGGQFTFRRTGDLSMSGIGVITVSLSSGPTREQESYVLWSMYPPQGIGQETLF